MAYDCGLIAVVRHLSADCRLSPRDGFHLTKWHACIRLHAAASTDEMACTQLSATPVDFTAFRVLSIVHDVSSQPSSSHGCP